MKLIRKDESNYPRSKFPGSKRHVDKEIQDFIRIGGVTEATDYLESCGALFSHNFEMDLSIRTKKAHRTAQWKKKRLRVSYIIVQTLFFFDGESDVGGSGNFAGGS